MMDKQHGDYIFKCNVCGKTLETGQADFNTAINIMKRQGWKARKIGADWVHCCAGCGMPGERAQFAKMTRDELL